ncbi:membrane protein YfhO [Arcticibacter tournemirensis]|uniref:YfhO family protein n=1 Tax=Arcticibacter tournemirensis TaxID=699437 RepID=A0A5M9H877_9SPHI|nr:YfhO family protein [Arcticibacter tournemirensis]KAA8481378.1 YfhO family protein [Arcticibacter tournemirensis]TQM48961.1 membrane protein YfhO [Arcticibacter tournemirensis]
MSNWFKRNGVHLAIIGLFIVMCFIYFSPALQGKILYQGDVLQAKAMQKEIMDFKAKDGTAPLWTNSMFGGMPAYQIWAQFPKNITTYVITFFKTVFPNPIDVVLLYLLGAYLLFCALRVNPWLAAAGAIAFAFSSYNFIIIEAGHSNKALAIAFFAPVIAGVILTFRGKHVWGATIAALFLALEIRSNHIQMTYYLFLVLLILAGIELYHAIKTKTTKGFLKSVGFLAASIVLSVAVNAGTLWTTYEYGQESIRGKSNLKSEAAKPSNGLDREYAYQWSQGVGECITFLVPNAYGGASGSGAFGEDSEVAKTLLQRNVPAEQAIGFAKQMPTYWGDRPFTSGPYYFGAIVFFLFIFGLLILKDRLAWWIFGATLLTMFLSFGKNFPYISDLFFNYFPFYNKFRAVESTLAVTGLLFPILAVLAIQEIVSGRQDVKVLVKKLKYASFITGGLLLIVIIVPGLLFSFKSPTHEEFIQQLTQITGGDQGFANAIANALINDRTSLARTDALRSLLFVLIGAALLWALIKNKINQQIAFILFAAAILVDMWTVDRRYLNNEKFVDESTINQTFQPRQVDELILRDPSLNYRVLDLTINTFSSATASYFHKTVGGYHAAKLKRFQEVLDKQFNGAINEDVLDMLNTKYVITADEKGESQRIQNRSTACGNAWFVSKVLYVKNAEEEMTGISSFDPKKEAIVEESFKPLIDLTKAGTPDLNASIKLVDYHPDHLTYEYSAGKDMIAVFAEVWYDKGWTAYVDGEEIPHFRANYILRAAQLPGGNHKLEFKFEPASYYVGENISLAASILLVGGLGFAGYQEKKKKGKSQKVKS